MGCLHDHLPAEVYTVCGDVLLTPERVRSIEVLLRAGRQLLVPYRSMSS